MRSHKTATRQQRNSFLIFTLYSVRWFPLTLPVLLNNSTRPHVPKQQKVRSKNLVANLPRLCHAKLWLFEQQDFSIFARLAHCFGPRKLVGWVPSPPFFPSLPRCHRLILKTFFHLHNRMGSDSLLSYYLPFRTLCWKLIAAIQKGSVTNTPQWEFDIFLLQPT